MIDPLLWAKALQAAVNVLAEAATPESRDAPAGPTSPPPKSQTRLKAPRRPRSIVAPAGTADNLTSHRAKQLLRAHGLAEVAADDIEEIK